MTNAVTQTKQLKFVLDFEDVLAAYRLSLNPALREYRWSFVLLIFGLGYTICNALLDLESIFLFVTGVVLLGYGLFFLTYLFLFRSILFRRRVQKIFAQQASLRDEHEVEWNDRGLTVRTPVGSTSLPWERFIKFREGTEAFLLYQSDLLFNIVPKRYMTGDQIVAFRDQIALRLALG